MNINKKVNLYYILSITFGIAVAFFGAISYVYLIQSGYTLLEIGSYLSMFWISVTIFEIPTGIMVDVYKHKITVIIANIIRIIGLLFLIYNFKNFTFLIISALLTGFGEAMMSGNLTSWIVNEINKEENKIPLNHVFSKITIFSTISGAIAGYIGYKYMYNINITYPFWGAIICLVILIVLVLLAFPKEKEKNHNIDEDIKNIKDQYKDVLNHIKLIFQKKELYYLFAIYLILAFINIGPAEQWQKVYENNPYMLSLGIIWIVLGVAGLIGSYLPQKVNFKKITNKRILMFLILCDALIVGLQSLSTIFLPLFVLHLILSSFLVIMLRTYSHNYLVDNDDARTTFISVINTFDSLVMTILLSVSGFLSEKYTILGSWKIFVFIAIILTIIVSIKKNNNLKAIHNG